MGRNFVEIRYLHCLQLFSSVHFSAVMQNFALHPIATLKLICFKFASKAVVHNKCTKHQFIHMLTATFKDLHIENSKNYKR